MWPGCGAPCTKAPTAQLRQQLQACTGMGQQHSREQARLEELRTLIPEAHKRILSLLRSDQAAYDAACDYYDRLSKEQLAIMDRMSEYWLVQPARRDA